MGASMASTAGEIASGGRQMHVASLMGANDGFNTAAALGHRMSVVDEQQR